MFRYTHRTEVKLQMVTRRMGLAALLFLFCLGGCTVSGSDINPSIRQIVASDGAAPEEFELRVLDDGSAFSLILGPIDIPAGHHHGDHHQHATFPPVRSAHFPKRAHLTGFSYELVDGEGRHLPSELLHHMNVMKPDERELFLPIAQRLLAIGRETGAQSMPRLFFGHPVEEGTEIVVSAMLHNTTGRDVHGAYLVVHIPYVESGRPWPLFDVYPFQLDVKFPAGDKNFDLPPGVSRQSYEATPAVEGRIIALSSHLHDYARGIRLEDVTTGRLIWEGLPVQDEDGRTTGVTIGRLYWKLGEKIYPDRTYRVTVEYDNPTGDTLRDGGMGVVAGAFLPSSGELWPRPDRSLPLYRLDYMHFMREASGSYDEIAARLGVGTDSLSEGLGELPAAVDGHSQGAHGDHHH